MLTLLPSITLKISVKSSLCIGNNFSRATNLCSNVLDNIISLTAGILSSSKNICSVLQSPIPSAPNFIATLASLGVSALVLTCKVLYLSTQFIRVSKFPVSATSVFSTFPKYTHPVDPSKDI